MPMDPKNPFGEPPLDFNAIAIEAVRVVREIITNEPLAPRGLFWSLLWEAARLGHKQLLTTYLQTSQYMQAPNSPWRPAPLDAALVPRLALAIYFQRKLLEEPLPRPSAEVVPLRRGDGQPSSPGELTPPK